MTDLLPFATSHLIQPGSNDPRIDVVVGSVFHVAVSEAYSLYDFFRGPSGGIESHGYIRRDGSVEQYRDGSWEADAQNAGNSWWVGNKRYGFHSWETQGMGKGKWTNAQLATIKRIIMWEHQKYGYPLQVAKSPQPAKLSQGGIGYHSLYKAWNPSIHSCPGPDRIKQFNDIIVPWLTAPKEYYVATTVYGASGTPDADAVGGYVAGKGKYSEVSFTTSLTAAKKTMEAGARLIVVGGPAAKALGLAWGVLGEVVRRNNVIICNGKTYDDSVVLMVKAIKEYA